MAAVSSGITIFLTLINDIHHPRVCHDITQRSIAYVKITFYIKSFLHKPFLSNIYVNFVFKM